MNCLASPPNYCQPLPPPQLSCVFVTQCTLQGLQFFPVACFQEFSQIWSQKRTRGKLFFHSHEYFSYFQRYLIELYGKKENS